MRLYLLDSSFLIDYSKGEEEKLLGLARKLIQEKTLLCTCDIVLAEYTAGLSPAQHKKMSKFVKNLYYLPASRQIAEEAGQIFYKLFKIGKTTPLSDCFVAALAKSHRAGIITRDEKHFSNLSNLIDIDITFI